ncbi:MAG: L-2-amino-thiazoline-4-carboxylic acid hydrolase [Proteobacteria bacterium]|nr:L-2-amino-thiazoline-4-carboxylic acid hydrolase [Pseudomonadota bacterium]
MKKYFRLFIGFIVVAPIALLTYFVSFFTGKQKAVEILGPKVTMIAKLMQQFFPPKISSASEFSLFKSKLKDKRKIWSMLYDYPIEYPDDNTVKLMVKNCPFAEAIVKLNIPEFGCYMCQGDWEVAKDNSDKWTFERNCTIGTGGTVCDFTYKQIECKN